MLFRRFRKPLPITIIAVAVLIAAWQLFLVSSLRYRLVFVSANLFLFLVLAVLTADSLLS